MVTICSCFVHDFLLFRLQFGYLFRLRYQCDGENSHRLNKRKGSYTVNKKWVLVSLATLMLSGSLVACSSTTGGTPEPATQQEQPTGGSTAPQDSTTTPATGDSQSTDGSGTSSDSGSAGSTDSSGSTDTSGSTDSTGSSGSTGSTGSEGTKPADSTTDSSKN